MNKHLVDLLKSTCLYSGTQIFSRLLTFFFLPLTTTYLTLHDYGLISALVIFGQLVNGLFSLGFGVSLNRFYSQAADQKTKDGVVWSAFIALFIHVFFLCLVAIVFDREISWITFGSEKEVTLIILNTITIAISTITLPFLSAYRLENKLKFVLLISLLEVVINVGLAMTLLIAAGLGVLGMVVAALIAQSITCLIVIIYALPKLQFSFRWPELLAMLKLGIPYIWGINCSLFLQCSSRYFLQFFSGLDMVGLFFMGANFARIIELPILGFLSAWPVFFSRLWMRGDGPVVLPKVLSYYFMVTSIAALAFFGLSKTLVHVMVQPPYYSSWTVVGIMALSYVIWGAYSMILTSFAFDYRGWMQMATEIGCCILNILLNCLLIPLFQKDGAAWATLFSMCALLFTSLVCNASLFHLAQEKIRLSRIFSFFICGSSLTFLPIANRAVYLFLMAFTMVFYCVGLWLYCLSKEEKMHVRTFFKLKKITAFE